MEQRMSALIGVIGGIVDLIAGFAVMQTPLPTQTMGMQTTMSPNSNMWTSYFLIALGVVVLITGLYLFSAKMMMRDSTFGPLMILYGVIMLILGVGMIGQMISMMQGSLLSGMVMMVLGLAMLYSGATMTRK